MKKLHYQLYCACAIRWEQWQQSRKSFRLLCSLKCVNLVSKYIHNKIGILEKNNNTHKKDISKIKLLTQTSHPVGYILDNI